jgi:membrane protein DedA with SNARE-associated domain
VWATGISLLAYWAGKAVADTVGKYGLYGAIGLIALGALVLGGLHVWRKRMIASTLI